MSQNKPTIEDKIAELEQRVAWFDSDEFRLDQAIERYTEAEKLSNEITKELTELKNTIIKADEEK